MLFLNLCAASLVAHNVTWIKIVEYGSEEEDVSVGGDVRGPTGGIRNGVLSIIFLFRLIFNVCKKIHGAFKPLKGLARN